MRFAISIVFIFIAYSAGAVKNRAVLPPHWQGSIQLDQRRNIPLPPGVQPISGKIVPIYHIDVPIEEARLYQSQYLDENTKSTVFVRMRGKIHVRIFFLEKTQFPKAQQTHWGTKVLSHNTYFVFDPANSRHEELYIKFQSSDGSNNETQVWQAINNNDTVETILKDNIDSSILYLPERFGVGYKNHAYSLRKANPKTRLSANKSLLPLHSIFTPDKSEKNPELARAVIDVVSEMMGISKEEWILHEYLPKLTKYILTLAIRYGIIPAAHTQNLQIVLNNKTGEVEGFAFRDMNDVLIDPTLQVLRSNGADIRLPVSSVNISFIDADNLDARGIGKNLGTYFLQSVFGITSDRKLRFEIAAQFVSLFKHHFEEISGLQIPQYGSLFEAKSLARNPHAQRVYHLTLQAGMQQSFDLLMNQRTSHIRGRYLKSEQERLRQLFYEKLKTFEVIPVKPHLLELIQLGSMPRYFELRGNMIICRMLVSKDVVAIAYNVQTRPKFPIKSCRTQFK